MWLPSLNDALDTEQEAPLAAVQAPRVHWPSKLPSAETLAVPVTATVAPPLTVTAKDTEASTVEGLGEAETVVVLVPDPTDTDRLPSSER